MKDFITALCMNEKSDFLIDFSHGMERGHLDSHMEWKMDMLILTWNGKRASSFLHGMQRRPSQFSHGMVMSDNKLTQPHRLVNLEIVWMLICLD
jgi:hypothetical protein